jgi:hypothetical protein
MTTVERYKLPRKLKKAAKMDMGKNGWPKKIDMNNVRILGYYSKEKNPF